MLRPLLFGWAGLLALLGVQVGLAFLPLGQAHLYFALGLSVAMATIIAWIFMELAKAPHLARIFAYGGLCWVMVLFTLGGSDYVTRAWNRVTESPAVSADQR
jgi:caa(3)-type oxidase subunit IV